MQIKYWYKNLITRNFQITNKNQFKMSIVASTAETWMSPMPKCVDSSIKCNMHFYTISATLLEERWQQYNTAK